MARDIASTTWTTQSAICTVLFSIYRHMLAINPLLTRQHMSDILAMSCNRVNQQIGRFVV